MPYCMECGAKLVTDAKFCQKCGSPTNINEPDKTTRQQEFAGKIYKCPSCGEVINAFVTHCPSCGHELRGASAANAVKEFSAKLNRASTENQRIQIIRSFPIPNTKEDIFEFMILASSNINSGIGEGTIEAWRAKFEQAYQKAKLSFEDEKDFVRIQRIYEETTGKVQSVKRNKAVRKIAPFVLPWLLAIGAVAAFVLTVYITGPSEEEEAERLNNIVAEVGTAMEDGEFDLALMHAKSIDYSGALVNDELERQWDIKRDYLIKKVISEAEQAGIKLEYPTDTANEEDRKPKEESTDGSEFVEEPETVPKTTEEETAETVIEPETDTDTRATEDETVVTASIEKGTIFTYGYNEYDLYCATALSDSLIRIEKWGRHMSTEKSFDNEYEVGVFKITDEANGFYWRDSEQKAFSFMLQDKEEFGFRKPKEVVFTVVAVEGDRDKGTNITNETDCYEYKGDDWHLYKAVMLTEEMIKIECWYRSAAFGSFQYGYDVITINTNDGSVDFEWVDDDKDSFTYSLEDEQNGKLKKPKFVAFIKNA